MDGKLQLELVLVAQKHKVPATEGQVQAHNGQVAVGVHTVQGGLLVHDELVQCNVLKLELDDGG